MKWLGRRTWFALAAAALGIAVGGWLWWQRSLNAEERALVGVWVWARTYDPGHPAAVFRVADLYRFDADRTYTAVRAESLGWPPSAARPSEVVVRRSGTWRAAGGEIALADSQGARPLRLDDVLADLWAGRVSTLWRDRRPPVTGVMPAADFAPGGPVRRATAAEAKLFEQTGRPAGKR